MKIELWLKTIMSGDFAALSHLMIRLLNLFVA